MLIYKWLEMANSHTTSSPPYFLQSPYRLRKNSGNQIDRRVRHPRPGNSAAVRMHTAAEFFVETTFFLEIPVL